MSAAHRILRGVGAAVAIVAVVAGVPVALWWLAVPRFGSLLDGGSVVELLLRPDDGALLLSALAAVAAVAWLVLTVSILGELVAAVMRRPAPRIDLPGFRLAGAAAAALVAALLGASPALADPMPPATSVVAIADPVPVTSRTIAASEPGPEHIVCDRDTLWGIAERRLDDPLRWREILGLNVDRVQADGGRLTESAVLTPGWVLILPGDASTTITVEDDDTLSELAGEHLGDPDRAGELAAVNANTPQPDGRRLTSPDQIHPGWTLSLPGADSHVIPRPPRTAQPSPPTTEVQPTLPGTVGAVPPIPTSSPGPAPPDPTGPGAPAIPTARQNPAAGPTGARATPAESRESQSDDRGSSSASIVLPLVGITAAVAAGLLAALTVRRRRQQRHRPHRHRIAMPGDEAGRREWTMDQQPLPDVEDRLDLALRWLVHPDALPEPTPLVERAERSRSSVSIRLAAPASLPGPFEPTAEQTEWTLELDMALPVPDCDVAGFGSPYPTLATIATDGERTMLIDLEQRRVLRLGGNAERARSLMRHVAAELATSAGAEDVEVLVVGLGEEPETFNPDRVIAMPDLATAVADLERRAITTRMELARRGLTSTVEGRLRHNSAGCWLPTVLLAADEPDTPDRERIDELLTESSAGTTGVAIVVIDHAHPDLLIDENGTITSDDPDGTAWRAVQLTDSDGDQLAELLATTDDPAVPAGPADGDEPWSTGMDEDGALGQTGGDIDVHDVPPDPVPATHEPPDEHNDLPPTRPVDPEARRRLAIVDHQDPDLDRDHDAWHANTPSPVPMIGILGEPQVRGTGPAPTTRPSWFTEVLVYLSLHPAGVTQAKAATDLWPDGHRISPATIRHAFYGARRWAGRGLGGDPSMTFVSDLQTDNSYRLRGHLLDWDLFRRLRKRAQARHLADHSGAVDDYRAALDLVRGPVLGSLRPGGYAWLNNHDQRHDLQIPGFIVDTAHELVDIALAAGDLGLARHAAERARDVDVDVAFDRPLTDLMRVAHAEDNRAELELYGAILLDARGFDVPEELAPESFTVLNELLPSGPRRSRP